MNLGTIHKAISERAVAALLATLLLALISLTVHALDNKEKIMPQEVTLQLGKKGPESFKQAGAIADHHTAGELVGFLDLNWPSKQLGAVTIRHSGHDLTIPHTFTAMGSVRSEPEGEGVNDIVLNSGISASELIRHREAYDLWVKLMKRIQDSGWQRYIYLSSPRLTGKDAIRYFQGEENFGLGDITDPGVVPDFNTWYSVIRQGGFIVNFYLDGVEMSLSFDSTVNDQEDLDDINKTLSFKEWGQYMMRIEFKTARYSTRNDIYNTFIPDGYGIDKLQEEMDKISSRLPEYWQRYRNIELAKRKKEEAMLVSKGYKIDEGYQDPDLLPYLQKEPKF
ncbi:hypothetical protein [Neisseria sp. HMSC074B07]|jgi:hypothetical protein|uniref:hypothetical protein n=1 Tax=Neisseria sp. HMSC074B07 TaxID=1715205 RepID=UPI0008A360FA|nr:hypothetical protein [Neisseria sp. HMSC074B07]OFM03996.1 hypothetical protein HMPREF2726_01235 [Neisseria sp. HMSC074B07]